MFIGIEFAGGVEQPKNSGMNQIVRARGPAGRFSWTRTAMAFTSGR
jgi:hypothetical protein